MCPLRKRAEAEGFQDRGGKLAAADKELSKSDMVVTGAENTASGDNTSKKRKKTQKS